MIINENAKRGIWLASPFQIVNHIEPDLSSKYDLNYLRYLIANEQELIFYSSQIWRDVRERVRQRDHYECQKCNLEKRLTTRTKSGILEVHHIAELSLYPEHCLNLNNLVTLCHSCHNVVHGRFQVEDVTKTFTNFDTTERW